MCLGVVALHFKSPTRRGSWKQALQKLNCIIFQIFSQKLHIRIPTLASFMVIGLEKVDIKLFFCHATSPYHVNKESYDFVVGDPLS